MRQICANSEQKPLMPDRATKPNVNSHIEKLLCKPLETCPPGLKIGPNFSGVLTELPNGKENWSHIFWLSSGDPSPPTVSRYLFLHTSWVPVEKYQGP